jgi:cytochrome c556
MMKSLSLLAAASLFSVMGSFVQAAEDPFADAVETRHGLMLQMAADMAKMGAMVKGDTAYDATIAAKAAANVAAIASVISMEQFPAGSENGKSADSFAKVELWADGGTDFLAKVADLNTAAVALAPLAAADVDSLKTGMGAVGKACGACHTPYRMTEN